MVRVCTPTSRMAARIESRLARSSPALLGRGQAADLRIGCIRALHRISSVAAGDIDDDAGRVNELLNGTGAHPVLDRHDGEPLGTCTSTPSASGYLAQFKEIKRTQQRTLNPRVRGSSPWRRTRSDPGL